MAARTTTPTTISAISDRIEAVAQHEPASLADFVGDGPVHIEVLDVRGRPVHIIGTTRPCGSEVLLAEPRRNGEQPRTWRIDQDGSACFITTRSAV